MNKNKFDNFLKVLFYLFFAIIMVFFTLWCAYGLASFLSIKLPKTPTIYVLLQINFLTILKVSFFIGIIDIMLFLFSGVALAMHRVYQGRRDEDYTTKELKLHDTISRLILGSFIPCVSLFSLSENQFSSLVNISALFAIFVFFFNIGRRK
jgi:hypothetical protein